MRDEDKHKFKGEHLSQCSDLFIGSFSHIAAFVTKFWMQTRYCTPNMLQKATYLRELWILTFSNCNVLPDSYNTYVGDVHKTPRDIRTDARFGALALTYVFARHSQAAMRMDGQL